MLGDGDLSGCADMPGTSDLLLAVHLLWRDDMLRRDDVQLHAYLCRVHHLPWHADVLWLPDLHG